MLSTTENKAYGMSLPLASRVIPRTTKTKEKRELFRRSACTIPRFRGSRNGAEQKTGVHDARLHADSRIETSDALDGTDPTFTMMAANQTDSSSGREEQRHKSSQEPEEDETLVVADSDDADGADEEQFVAIELTNPCPCEEGRPSRSSDEPSETPTSQAQTDREGCIEEDEVMMKLPAPPSECRPNSDPHLVHVPASAGQEARLNTGRRRVLHHPILSPLTKLPWGKLATAAGSCDLLFNCKYTMRQVEHEVKQEQHRIENGNEDSAYENQSSDRKNGYVGVSLGLVEQEADDSLPFFGLQEHEAADIEEVDAPATDARQESRNQPEAEEAHFPVSDAVNMMVYKGLIGE